jgi:preprotein translocase subunit SecF
MAERTASTRQVPVTPPRFVELVPSGTRIDFVRMSRYGTVLSGVVVLVALAMLYARGGPNYGIDFAGGTLIHLRFAEARRVADVRGALAGTGFGDVEMQDFGREGMEFLLRVPGGRTDDANVAEAVEGALHGTFGAEAFEVLRAEMVGPKVGKDLTRKAILAVLASTVMMGIYLWIRFELRFGVGAATALLHDVIVTLGALAVWNYEVDLTTVAALLTVVGFSVNDTVIISDRVRENMRKMRRETLATIVNQSVNETLSRTVLTTGTAVLVILALFFLGGGVIHGFAFTLLVGFIVGTYSTIFIACPVVLALEGRRRR